MQPPDENGNEWIDDPTPSALEIADVVLERIKMVGWDKAWDANGLNICTRYLKDENGLLTQCPGTYVFLNGYQDLDWRESFLLEVCTEVDSDGTTKTMVDYVGVYWDGNTRLVEWAQRPHEFFADEGADKRNEALHWWVDWTEEADA